MLDVRNALLLAALLCPLSTLAPAQAPAYDAERYDALEWREVGPYRGGRSAAATGIPGQPLVYYFGAAGGGVWKTTDAGESWKNVSDGSFGGSIGAVAVSEWDPNVVYVGGGEKTVRGNVSHGDGMWRSDDAGKTWRHVGLADSRRIPRIRVHPRDPDLVYVAALGHLFGPNEERGVFRSKDGGVTWEKVLYGGPDAGAVDLCMDPTNPRILYASLWRIRRTPYSLESGGEGSSLWKSTDGGDTWTELTGNEGMPKGTLGIIGVTVSPTNPENVYAIVEAEDGGVFRSRDGGEKWTKVNSERKLRQRAWYYSRIYADPADEESVYVLNVQFHRSKDGGKTYTTISVPHGDNHDLWIAPDDPKRMIQANDGGANVSFDGGVTWSRQSNQPTAQMYRVSTDNAFPYRLLGGQQDNSTVRIRSRSFTGGPIGDREWSSTAGGESGHVVAHPDEPDIVYGGSYDGVLTRVNHETGERRSVHVWPDNPMGWGAAELKYRFQWNFPIFFSPHHPHALYTAAQVLFRSRDEGASWEAISPDLTRNDKSKMGPSGGPITKDNTSVEYYGTIFAALESPHEEGVFWCGSDDGLLHLSRDDGASWSNVTPEALPEWGMINCLDPHPTNPAGLYLAATSYKLDDFTPYLFKTSDWGATWTRIDTGIPRDHFTRALRADPDRPGLLYAGTERGVYVSFDDGGNWKSLQTNLPIVPITDLAVKWGDLVAATQGRGYWILDDLSALHGVDATSKSSTPHLFTPRPTLRIGSGRSRSSGDAGTNAPGGALIHYWLPADLDAGVELRLDVLEPDGDLVRSFTRKPGPDEDAKEGAPPKWLTEDPRQLESDAGLHRFAWNMQYPEAERFDGMVLWNSNLSGPRAVPGVYRARLVVGEWSAETPFEIRPDPRSTTSIEDLRAQFDFLIETRDKLTDVHRAIRKLRDARKQIEAFHDRLGHEDETEALHDEATGILDTLEEVEKALYQTKNQSRQDPLNFPIRLNDKLGGLRGWAGTGDYAPTRQSYEVKAELFAAIDAQLERLHKVWTRRLPVLNRGAVEASTPAIVLDGE